MSETIWKFELAPEDRQSVIMPRGARIISAGAQGDRICVWAVVDPLRATHPRGFLIVGTGHALNSEGWDFVDTVQLADGALVFHVFAAPSGSLEK